MVYQQHSVRVVGFGNACRRAQSDTSHVLCRVLQIFAEVEDLPPGHVLGTV